MKNDLFRNRKAQEGGVGMAIVFAFIVLAVIGVIQLVAVLITSKVSANIDQDSFTTEENTTTANLKANNLSSFELGGTAQIVFAATVILLSVFGILATMRGR